jgi:hypothetical protein
LPAKWEELTGPDFVQALQASKGTCALPFGIIEKHGPAGPLGTDLLNIRYTTGLAWGRVATIRGLNQGSESVRIEPIGTRRTDAVSVLDFRVEKTFPIGSSPRQAGIYLDLFNINNQGVNDNGIRTAVQESSGSSFGNPNAWISPRIARLGFRFTF